MKALMINGSPHAHGTTRRALDEMAKVLTDAGIETEIMTIGHKAIRGCIACGRCDGRCRAFDDEVNQALSKLEQADALILAAPVYFASPNGTMLSFLDRMFSAGNDEAFAGKPAACIAVARRAGTTTSIDALLKYPAIKGMPIVTSSYWPMLHGSSGVDAGQDEEGLQVLRNLGHNLAWLLACIRMGAENGHPYPTAEQPGKRTDFCR